MSGGSGGWFEDEPVAERFELSDGARSGLGGTAPSEVVRTRFAIELAVGERLPDGDEVAVLGSRGRPAAGASWETVTFDVPVLARTRIAPDASQVFVVDARAISALRVSAYPDGGIARACATGRPTAAGFADLAARWEASA